MQGRYPLIWPALQALGLITIILIVYGMLTGTHILGMHASRIFWTILIPLMILTIYLAPGVWRNICPLATTNLIAYTLRGKRALERDGRKIHDRAGIIGTIYAFLRTRGTLISAILFWTIVPARLILFNGSPYASAILIISLFTAAFLMGILFPVKSGWCMSICPVLSIEKAYSINPALRIRNIRCDYTPAGSANAQPCSGCSTNCIDILGHEKTYLMENTSRIHHDTTNAAMRKIFIATLPGFIAGYFMIVFQTPITDLFSFTLAPYVIIANTMLISYLLYALIKSSFRKRIIRTEGDLTIDKPNPHYALLKRRLDLSWVSVCIFIFFGSTIMRIYPDLIALLIPALLVTITMFIAKGWNGTISTPEKGWW